MHSVGPNILGAQGELKGRGPPLFTNKNNSYLYELVLPVKQVIY
jgi:hypothetical protein